MQNAVARDLVEVQDEGVLRHIGAPYSKFIAYSDKNGFQTLSGLDIELMQGFARYIGVKYQFVSTTATTVFGQLNGQEVSFRNGEIFLGKKVPVQGDVIACGMTVLDWRSRLADFADDYFPSGIWLIARGDSDLKPIVPTGFISEDIKAVKRLVRGRSVLTMEQSCTDATLYNLEEAGAKIALLDNQRNLNEMVPAILNNDAELALLDVADALLALEKWPGEVKVIGPVSQAQVMAPMFRKESPILKREFNKYLQKIKEDGTYILLVKKYYPSVFFFYKEYFEKNIKPSDYVGGQ